MERMASNANRFPDYTFRPRNALILAIVAIILCAVGVVASVLGGVHWFGVLLWLTAGLLAYILWVHPRVAVTDDAVTFVNPFSDITIPWDAIINVETKYSVTVNTPGKKYAAWAAPAPGATSSLRESRRTEREYQRADGRDKAKFTTMRAGDHFTTDSGIVAKQIRDRLADKAERGLLDIDRTETAVVSRRWNLLHLASLLLLLVATIVTGIAAV